MKVTEILRRRGHILEVRFDDGTYINLDKSFFETLSLKAGDEISEDAANDLEDRSDFLRCKNRAFYYLSNSSISEKNLRAKLLKTGFAPWCVEETVKRCKELGYINDESYALRLKEKCDENNLSNRATKEKLITSGISSERAKEICIYDSLFEQEKIRNLLNSKYKNKLYETEGVRKVTNSLIRSGFLFSDINSVMKLDVFNSEE